MNEINLLIGVLGAIAVAVVLAFVLRRTRKANRLTRTSSPSPASTDMVSAEEASTSESATEADSRDEEAAPSATSSTNASASQKPTDDENATGTAAPAEIIDASPVSEESRRPEPSSAAEQSAPTHVVSAPAAATSEPPDEALSALKRGLTSTRNGFVTRLAKLFKGKPTLDASLFDEIEEILLSADIGSKTCEQLLQALRQRVESGQIDSGTAAWDALSAEVRKILEVEAPPISLQHKPSLILVAGVNGVGKTTTIGKLASKYIAEGRRVLLAAGDTYRAAAVLQLDVWGQRVGCPIVKGKEGADPGSVIFDAITRARDEGYDLVIADTAGRLHTKQPLMDELKKVDRTITKALGGRGADEILLVLDATTGQNAVQQMHMFREALKVTGVVLTKLDGTAKGGVVLGIVSEHKVPVRFVGLGERVEDLREFSAEGFVRALFERPSNENMAA